MKRLLIFFFISIFFGCEDDNNVAKNYIVSGTIRNGLTPVENASVELDNLIQFATTTDENGYFEIKDVSPGEYSLEVVKGSESGQYSRINERIVISNADIIIDNFQLPEPVSMNEPEIVQSVENSSVKLTWSQYEGDDFREYKIYKHETSGIDENTAELIHVTTFRDEVEFTLELPHNSETYFRVFVLDENGLLGGSNVTLASIGSFSNDEEIILGNSNEYFLNASEEQTLYFNAEENTFYAIQWFDAWFDDFTAASIVVAASNPDATNYYFRNERLIQMNGSPMPVFSNATERVNLEIKGYNSEITGTYGVKVTELISNELTVGSVHDIEVDLGATKLFDFEADAGKSYKITLLGTVPVGAYGDGNAVHFSLIEENADSFIEYKESISNTCCGSPDEYTVSTNSDKKIYLILDGAYWFIPNNIQLSIQEL